MQITIGGIIYIFLLLYVFLKKQNSLFGIYRALFNIAVLTEFLLGAGYIIKIGSFEVAYNYLCSVALLIPSILICIKYRKKIRNSLTYVSLFFILELLVGASFSIVSSASYRGVPFSGSWDDLFFIRQEASLVYFDFNQFSKIFVRILIFVININAFSIAYNRNALITSSRIFYRIGIVVLFFALVEFLSDNIFSSTFFRSVILQIVGKRNADYAYPRAFNNIYSPLLSSNEPSAISFTYFFFALVSFSQIILNFRKRKSPFIVSFILFLMLMISTAAMTSLLLLISLVFVIVVYLLGNRYYFAGCIVVALSLIAVITATILYGNRISNIFEYFSLFDLGITSLPARSEIVRMYSIYSVLKLFLSHPLFGIGLGICYAYGSVPTLLCNIGLVGFILWTLVVKSSMFNLRISKSTYFLSFINFFLILFFFSGHMGEMIYLERSYFVLVLLAFIADQREKEYRFVRISPHRIQSRSAC